MKTCTKCGTARPREEFPPRPSARDGLSSWCRPCNRHATNDYNARNVHATAGKRYGIPAGRVARMRESDCEICGKPPEGDGGRVQTIDHDHACCPGKFACGECIRGTLCNSCNVGLGHFQESPVVLAKAIAYLTNYQGRNQK